MSEGGRLVPEAVFLSLPPPRALVEGLQEEERPTEKRLGPEDTALS